jgi:pSer/pThr/pTyr-binding forkhead associated (FHA) protein
MDTASRDAPGERWSHALQVGDRSGILAALSALQFAFGMRLALRFISGKYQGGEFPLEEQREIIVGRSSDLDMVLVEEMVSRRHARIQLVGGSVNIDDLGSTNGTFVNGERVTHAELQEGDRVLIGSNILKVVSTDGSMPLGEPMDAVQINRGSRSTGSDARMSGNLEEIPLPDLLQLFGSSRKTGTLTVTSQGKVGRIHLRGGLVHFVEAETDDGDSLPLSGLKMVYRMLSWERGLFELTPEDPRKFDPPLDLNVQEVLMEGFRQKDELAQLAPRLPGADAELKPVLPLEPRLSELKPEQLDIFQTVLNAQTMSAILDQSPFEDFKTSQLILELIQKGYIEA